MDLKFNCLLEVKLQKLQGESDTCVRGNGQEWRSFVSTAMGVSGDQVTALIGELSLQTWQRRHTASSQYNYGRLSDGYPFNFFF